MWATRSSRSSSRPFRTPGLGWRAWSSSSTTTSECTRRRSWAYPNLDDPLKRAVESLAHGYASPRQFFELRLAEGIATIAAAFWPKPVIVRLSDFKSNEYRKLIGGSRYEPEEENPMLGFRGAGPFSLRRSSPIVSSSNAGR